VDEAGLPVSLQLRQNRLCIEPQKIGANVTVAFPRTLSSGIIPPQLMHLNFELALARSLAMLTLVHQALGFAGYFVPASKIADLIPPEFRL
jgi:hypothetical protein